MAVAGQPRHESAGLGAGSRLRHAEALGEGKARHRFWYRRLNAGRVCAT